MIDARGLDIYECTNTIGIRGTREALTAAKYVPANVPFPGDPGSEAFKRGVRWTNERGERVVLCKSWDGSYRMTIYRTRESRVAREGLFSMDFLLRCRAGLPWYVRAVQSDPELRSRHQEHVDAAVNAARRDAPLQAFLGAIGAQDA